MLSASPFRDQVSYGRSGYRSSPYSSLSSRRFSLPSASASRLSSHSSPSLWGFVSSCRRSSCHFSLLVRVDLLLLLWVSCVVFPPSCFFYALFSRLFLVGRVPFSIASALFVLSLDLVRRIFLCVARFLLDEIFRSNPRLQTGFFLIVCVLCSFVVLLGRIDLSLLLWVSCVLFPLSRFFYALLSRLFLLVMYLFSVASALFVLFLVLVRRVFICLAHFLLDEFFQSSSSPES